MSSLDDLHAKLQAINNQFKDTGEDFDKYYNFEGISFHYTHNEKLGLTGQSEDFITKIPYIEQQGPNVDPATVAKQWPSALQKAFMDVLEAGKSEDNKTCFIDICSWADDAVFYIENETGSVRYPVGNEKYSFVTQKVMELVNACDSNVTPVIRMIGLPHDKAELLFWKDGNLRVPLTRKSSSNPPMLYAGTYGPTFKDPDTGPIHQWLDDRLSFLDYYDTLMSLASLGTSNQTKALVQDKSTKQQIVDFLTKKGLPGVSFTHAKFLAVNGKVLMTGGANNSGCDYITGTDPNIVDHQAKIIGDAAVSAHKWADYLWKYLNKVHPSDDASLGMRTQIADEPNWQPVCQPPTGSPLASKSNTVVEAAPLFMDTFASWTPTTKLTYPVLSVARLGSWHSYQFDLDYPSQIIDALRDLVTTLLYQKLQGNPKQGLDTILVLASMTDDGDFWSSLSTFFEKLEEGIVTPGFGISNATTTTMDTVLAKLGDQREIAEGLIGWWKIVKAKISTDFNPYHRLKINPTAWASRYARNAVIANAKQTVRIPQPCLAGWLQLNQPGYQSLVNYLNAHGANNWDGIIWGYDLFVALAYFLCTISSDDAPSDSGVYMMLSTHTQKQRNAGYIRDRWNDPAPAQQIKDRVKVIMQALVEINNNPLHSLAIMALGSFTAGLFTSFGTINAGGPVDVDQLVDKKLHIRRVFKADGTWMSHIKSVCADDKLMYVGSDNAYPHYNEEHGIWIDDHETIKEWKDGYWQKYWDHSTDALAATETGPDVARMKEPDNNG